MSLDDMARPLNLAGGHAGGNTAGAAEFSWRRPCTAIRGLGSAPFRRSLARYSTKCTRTRRQGDGRDSRNRRQLELHKKYGAEANLTGPVIIPDNEFAGVHQGVVLNNVVTGGIVLIIMWLALRTLRLVAAVVLNLAAGLAITAAGGILMVGALNPISLAFAVLFVGLGADFAIQYTVRYRAERHEIGKLGER